MKKKKVGSDAAPIKRLHHDQLRKENLLEGSQAEKERYHDAIEDTPSIPSKRGGGGSCPSRRHGVKDQEAKKKKWLLELSCQRGSWPNRLPTGEGRNKKKNALTYYRQGKKRFLKIREMAKGKGNLALNAVLGKREYLEKEQLDEDDAAKKKAGSNISGHVWEERILDTSQIKKKKDGSPKQRASLISAQ